MDAKGKNWGEQKSKTCKECRNSWVCDDAHPDLMESQRPALVLRSRLSIASAFEAFGKVSTPK
jgi:hypothetical protein